ncbi:MAG: hypothetical protein ACYSWO_21800 [Planctomycetota bacterium]|jgi:hypothetical protein
MTDWVPPTIMQKIAGFTISYADWAAEGFPRRSPEWIAEIFAEHCQPCEWYAPEEKTLLGRQGVCRRCGCHVSAAPRRLDNKLLLPNTSCPLDPPLWGSSVEVEPNPDSERSHP